MQTPIYVYHELIIRLQELYPVGDYQRWSTSAGDTVLHTTTGRLKVPDDILKRQLEDPATISAHELLSLLDGFSQKG
jgi:hypothetical protein